MRLHNGTQEFRAILVSILARSPRRQTIANWPNPWRQSASSIVGIGSEPVGVLLWPAIALHAIFLVLLGLPGSPERDNEVGSKGDLMKVYSIHPSTLAHLVVCLLILGALYSLQRTLDLGGSGGGLVGSAQAADETAKEMLAAQIRLQGFACDKALGATRDAKRSKPDYEVWVLRCGNAAYRVGRAPDMAAKVVPLR
jgi:hypothetical protein